MWILLSIILAATQAAPPERLLLIEDTGQPNLERTLVFQQLLTNLLRDPSIELVPHGAWPPQLHRSVALQESADFLANEARRHLHGLNPEQAAISASAARLRYSRVATLTGDLTGLTEAISLDAAAHLLQNHRKEALEALTELYTLDGTFVPQASLFNTSMQRTAREVARKVQHAPKDAVEVSASYADGTSAELAGPIAVFVDGHFLGFGTQCAALTRGIRHHLWFVPEIGEPQGTFVGSDGPGHKLPAAVHLALWPVDPKEPSSGHTAFGHVLAASRLATGQIDPHHPALAARRIDTVLVLAYAEGGLRLTTFELRGGQRRTSQAAAAITNLWDVARIADALLVAPLPLAATPTPH